MTTEPLDPAAIMATHADHGPACADYRNASSTPRCLPYRLAAEVTTLREREQRVRTLAQRYETAAAALVVRDPNQTLGEAYQRLEQKRLLTEAAAGLRAALDDPTETKQVWDEEPGDHRYDTEPCPHCGAPADIHRADCLTEPEQVQP